MRCLAKSRPNCDRPVSSGTARLSFASTGDVVGDSLGKRVAAADGEKVSADAALLVLWCVLSCSATGLAGGPGPGPLVGGFRLPIAS